MFTDLCFDLLPCGLLIKLSWIFNDFSYRRHISNFDLAGVFDKRGEGGLGPSAVSTTLYLAALSFHIWNNDVLKIQNVMMCL